MLKKYKQNAMYSLLLFVAAFMLSAFPSVVAAHHPGIIGPLTHLGFRQVIVVLGAALIDAFNPTAFGALILIVHQTVSRKAVIKSGLMYLLGILLVYVLAGLLLRESYVHGGPTFVLQTIQLILAGMLFYTGFSEILRALNIVTLPGFGAVVDRLSPYLERGFALPVGIFVGIIELFSTGAIYFSFIQALAFDHNANLAVHGTLTVIYLIGFLLPLLLALIFVQQALPFLTEIFGGKKKPISVMIGVVLILAASWVAIRAIEGFLLLV